MTGGTDWVPLTIDLIEDDEAVAAWADAAIRGDPVAQARAKEVGEWRGYLRDACEPDVWALYLEVERRAQERWADLASVLVRYGFAAGQRHPLKSGEVGR